MERLVGNSTNTPCLSVSRHRSRMKVGPLHYHRALVSFLYLGLLFPSLIDASPYTVTAHVSGPIKGGACASRNCLGEGDRPRAVLNEVQRGQDALDDIYASPTLEEEKIIQTFDPSRLNYTALRLSIDEWLFSWKWRKGRLLGDGHLPGFLSSLGKMLDFDQVVKEIETSIMSSVSCNACRGGMGLLQHYIKTKKTKNEIIYAASKLCSSFKIETPRVCYGIINLMADEVIYVAQNVFMTPDEVCGFVIGDVCGTPYNPEHEWSVTFPPVPKPPLPPRSIPTKDQPTLKVLHLSDTHYDPEYLEGSDANCGEPLCCRKTSGWPRKKQDAAGYWGDYRKCDTPKRTIYSMFENIAYLHPDIDYIIWTGDLPPHDVWNQTKEANAYVLKETVKQLVSFFPQIPIFPALGNHESAPVNSFPPPYVPSEFGISWLYKELQKQWLIWLPYDTSETILKGGFYSVLVRPNFRILSINTNFCNSKNWWLLVNSTDPAQSLQWLIFELQAAEYRGEKVHIIGHIPPGHNDCLKVWSRNYYSIINRYESTIAAQFFGHTHFDEFELFYDEYRPKRAINVAYIGPSVTSYYGLNPGYRLYTIEGDYEGSTKRSKELLLSSSGIYLGHSWYISDVSFKWVCGVPNKFWFLFEREWHCETTSRYEGTIQGQFFGHTHKDEFEVFYDSADPRRATSVAYISPSITTFIGLNPGYRIFVVGEEDQVVLDHETWIMNLDDANSGGRPRWYQLYNALGAFGLRSLHPQEWDSLIYRMAQDDKLFDTYHRFYWKDSPTREKCDKDCKKRLLCDLKSGRSHDRQVTCAKVNEEVEAKERMGWGGWLFSGLTVGSLATWWFWG